MRSFAYAMLQSRWAPGRDYILFATDEIAPDLFNFNNSPLNIVGLRNDKTKLGVYADWKTSPMTPGRNRATMS